jgi:GxxExxY protein
MQKQGLSFIREQRMPVYYDGVQVGTRRVDFLVEEEEKILVEIKARTNLEPVHIAQAVNYLEAFR